MGQAAGVGAKDALDCVITNALVVDYTGIYKADIGIKDGSIAGIGKAGNPDVMAGVTQGMIVGVTTEVIAGEGLILTAGGLDTHIHFICPQQAHEAIACRTHHDDRRRHRAGDGTSATTCTPGARSTSARCCRRSMPCRSTSVSPARATRSMPAGLRGANPAPARSA